MAIKMKAVAVAWLQTVTQQQLSEFKQLTYDTVGRATEGGIFLASTGVTPAGRSEGVL